MPRRRYARSPGSLILAERGLFLADLAAEVGASISTVSNALRGGSPIPGGLLEAVERLAGDETADRLAAVLGVER